MYNWIWLDSEEYPESQTTKYGYFHKEGENNYAVAEFKKKHSFRQKVVKAELVFSGDTRFQLYLNGEILTTGPVMVGGDWLGNDKKRNGFYATRMTIKPCCRELDFGAKVLMMPVQMCDYSMGHGGFMLWGELTFEDDTKTVISTDNSWLARKLNAYKEPFMYDDRVMENELSTAVVTEDVWNCKIAPIPPMAEEIILPTNGDHLVINHNEKIEKVFDYDRIYAGYIGLDVKTQGELKVSVTCKETDEAGSTESFVFSKDTLYRSFKLHSAGKFVIEVENNSENIAELSVKLISRHYPVSRCGKIVTSDVGINKVMDVCAHTLKICRQSIHLDSPRHCEPLACTGDYYIETLMTLFSYGDMNLAKFDIRRTAGLLRENDGRIFHTTYSLIWTYWLWDVYMFTGDIELLKDCKDALKLLLKRFESYIGDNNLIETPPDYMFVDWIYIDGLSMHHPPKALGQTVLNMFYFKALKTAAEIYRELGEKEVAEKCVTKAECVKKAVNELLYDPEKEMYFEGLNTPTPECLLDTFMPQNTEKRYYLKHSNILAVYSGICDDERAKMLIKKVMYDEIEGDVQPYFLHYFLEGVHRYGLCDQFTIDIIDRWKSAIEDCEKGLVEGFVPPEPTYHFDHSHAWGGTPLYSLPKALLGFEIIEPGMKKIKLRPSLLKFEYADVEFPTPYGDVLVKQAKGRQSEISVPDEIVVV